MNPIIYELQLSETKADYLTFVGNPKNPHLPGLRIQLPLVDWNLMGQPQTVDVIVGLQFTATAEAPKPKAKAKAAKK